MPDEKPAGAQVERWLNLLGSVIAPATLIGALLFYFGYVSARAQYDYFGVDIDSVGLSTQGYVMRSPQPLLVPLLVLALLGAALVALHSRIRHRSDQPGFRDAISRSIMAGLGLVAVGLVLLFIYPLLSGWDPYPLVTALVLGIGGAVTAYGLGTLRYLDNRPGGDKAGADPTGRSRPTPRLAAIVLIWAAVAACVFWSTATVAQWSGRGLARHQAENLKDLPSVILDTKEPLQLFDEAGVHQRQLTVDPQDPDVTYHYRYWGLRLLIVGDNELYLVPEVWNPYDTTLLVPLDDSVRVQFQFRNWPP